MEKYEYGELVKNKLIKLLNLNPECKEILNSCSCGYELTKNATLNCVWFSCHDSIWVITF